MGSLSLVHWMIILLVVLLIFGGSRLSNVMGEAAKGIKAFKQGMREDEQDASIRPNNLAHDPNLTNAAPPPVVPPANSTVNSDRRVG